MKKQIVIHIGTHKTGSTSLQAALGENRSALLKQGAEYYTGMLVPNNHIELFLSTMRDGVDTFAGRKYPIKDKSDLYLQTKQRISDFIQNSPAHNFIFSAEGLSYLRTKEECQLLKELFPTEGFQIKILLTIRDKNEFLQSYKNQVWKTDKNTNLESTNPESGFYVADDTWLLDFETLAHAYEDVFGNLTTIPYTSHSLLKKIIAEMDVRLKLDKGGYRKNVSRKRNKLAGKIKNMLKSFLSPPELRK